MDKARLSLLAQIQYPHARDRAAEVSANQLSSAFKMTPKSCSAQIKHMLEEQLFPDA